MAESAEPNRSANSKRPAITAFDRMFDDEGWEYAWRNLPYATSSDRRPAPSAPEKALTIKRITKTINKQFGDGRGQTGQAEKAHIAGDQGQNQKSERPTKHDVWSLESRTQNAALSTRVPTVHRVDGFGLTILGTCCD